MHYKSKETYDSGYQLAAYFGAGTAFRRKNSYQGQPREERLAYGHRLAGAKDKAPKPPALSAEEVEATYKISTFTCPRDFALLAQVDWKQPNFGAVPYLEAMLDCDSFQSNYGCDSAASICRYFLANAATWRGPVARLAKARLVALLKRG